MTDIFELSDDAVERIADLDPIAATTLGLPGRDHLWPDLSLDGHAARRELNASLVAAAATADTSRDGGALAQRVLVDEASTAIAAHDDGAHLRDLNSIASSFQDVKDVFDVMDRDTPEAWRAVVARLETIHQPLSQYRSTLLAGIDEGEAVARRQVLAAAEEGTIAAGDRGAFAGLGEAFDASGIDDAALAARLDAAISHARTELSSLVDWLTSTYLPHARGTDAVGRDRYLTEARRHLGMSIDPDATYSWGWAEIADIGERMAEVAARIDPHRTLAEVVEMLGHDPDRGIDSVDQFLERMQAVQDDALAQLAGTHFDVPDEIRTIQVKAAPPGGALAPYYTGPSEDFSRPGTVWYPIGSRTFFPLWEEMTTAYHEGFPGHHLQVGVQAAMGDRLSRLHRLAVWWPGSGEGWALYAERVMGELGFHERPDHELGMLAAQMFRACRVVIDVGSHCELPIPDDAPFHPGRDWTWELAAEMIRDVGHQPDEMARSEATRYLGWPGQAITYKLGERVILDLRDELTRDGSLPLGEFHARVLGVGSIGLELLRDLVRGG